MQKIFQERWKWRLETRTRLTEVVLDQLLRPRKEKIFSTKYSVKNCHMFLSFIVFFVIWQPTTEYTGCVLFMCVWTVVWFPFSNVLYGYMLVISVTAKTPSFQKYQCTRRLQKADKSQVNNKNGGKITKVSWEVKETDHDQNITFSVI